MDTKKELKILFWMIVVYAAVFFMPLGNERFMTAVDATLDLAKWYAQEHVMLCLLPTFFIAGVIAVFVSQGSVLKYFGAMPRSGYPIRQLLFRVVYWQSVPARFCRCLRVFTNGAQG